MADQGRWFKLWCSADDDPDLSELSLEDFGRWCKLGMYLRRHGVNGAVSFRRSSRVLQDKFRVATTEETIEVLRRFPNCDVREERLADGPVENRYIIVTFRNWLKYQGDTSTERVRSYRYKIVSKKEKKNSPPLPLLEEKQRKLAPPPTPSTDKANAGAAEPKDKNSKAGGSLPAETFDRTWADAPWPSAQRLVFLYNSEAPDEWPSVELVSDQRAKKIHEYLTKFPKEEFWRTTFQQAKRSAFCRSYRNGGLDWLLQRGKHDSIENCLKAYEGKYADTTGQRTR